MARGSSLWNTGGRVAQFADDPRLDLQKVGDNLWRLTWEGMGLPAALGYSPDAGQYVGYWEDQDEDMHYGWDEEFRHQHQSNVLNRLGEILCEERCLQLNPR